MFESKRFTLVGCGGLERKKKHREDCTIGKANTITTTKLNTKHSHFSPKT